MQFTNNTNNETQIIKLIKCIHSFFNRKTKKKQLTLLFPTSSLYFPKDKNNDIDKRIHTNKPNKYTKKVIYILANKIDCFFSCGFVSGNRTKNRKKKMYCRVMVEENGCCGFNGCCGVAKETGWKDISHICNE